MRAAQLEDVWGLVFVPLKRSRAPSIPGFVHCAVDVLHKLTPDPLGLLFDNPQNSEAFGPAMGMMERRGEELTFFGYALSCGSGLTLSWPE